MKKTAYMVVALLIILSLPGKAFAAAKGPAFTEILSNNVVGVYVSPDFSEDKMLFSITKDQDKNGALYRSKDGGLSWEQNKLFIDGFSKDSPANSLILCDLLITDKGSIYLSLYDKDIKLYSFVKSDDKGESWKTIKNKAFYNLIYTGDSSFLGIDRASKRLQKSDSNGGEWFLKSDVPLRNSSMATADGQYILCVCNKTILMSSNNSGQSWDAVNGVGTDITDVFLIPDHEKNIFIASDSDEVMKAYMSMDNGKNWELMQFGSENKAKINCAAGLPGGIIVIGTNSKKVLISQDYGKTWKSISAGITKAITDIQCVPEGDSFEIFAGTSAGLLNLHYAIEEKENVKHQEIRFTVGSKEYTVAGETRQMDTIPFIDHGRVYVPLSYMGEALGAKVTYDESKKKATFTKGKIKIVVPLKGKKINVNGKTVTMDVAPIIKDGRLMLPASYIAEAFGYSIEWMADTNSVRIY